MRSLVSGDLLLSLAVLSIPARSPLRVIAMAVGFRQTRRVHPVYLLGLMVFIVRRYSVSLIAPSAEWESFVHWAFSFVR